MMTAMNSISRPGAELATVANITRKLAIVGAILALLVILLGAYTRLKDAGLGCPDWPTCYGHFSVPVADAELQKAQQLFPGQTVVAAKAWPEVIHRYFASSLGLVIAAITLLAWLARRKGHPLLLPGILMVLVCVQGAFGAWTVTMKLMPIVVTTHLLLGMTTFSLLSVLALQLNGVSLPPVSKGVRNLALLSLIIVFIQIFLGGWTSSNYAALVCVDLPVCQGDWSHTTDFASAFAIHVTDQNYEFGILNYPARMTIHVMHRFGAMAVFAMMGVLVGALWGTGQRVLQNLAVWMGFIVMLQVGLGISNVWNTLPLPNAVAHNVVGAVLLMTLIATNFFVFRAHYDRSHPSGSNAPS